ncbi:MAG TPA: DNA recombination protein RmuC, partial [Sphingomicrobium sp.]|nr:DNA recombination protein RmuC [Sphingomicrobium sp.]
MDATLTIILALIIGVALGALIGWLYAGRDAAAARQTVDNLRLQLDEVVRERDANRSAANELAGFRAAQEVRERAFEEKIAELVKAREELSAQFAEVGGKLLETAQKQFLDRADQRFRQSEESAGSNLKALLQPVHDRLQRYEEAVGKVEEERRKDFGLLSGHIEAMKSGTERVSAEAAKLVNALRNAPKARGRWGEQQLKNVLESCGLSEHCDFDTEVSRTAEDGGRLRPDVILRVPGGQS